MTGKFTGEEITEGKLPGEITGGIIREGNHKQGLLFQLAAQTAVIAEACRHRLRLDRESMGMSATLI